MEDYESAINPDLFAEYVEKLRICNDAQGDVSSEVDFGMSDSEKGYRKFVRRNVIAARRINAGDKVNVWTLSLKEAQYLIITNVDDVVGKLAVKDLQQTNQLKCLISTEARPWQRNLAALACRINGSRLYGKPV